MPDFLVRLSIFTQSKDNNAVVLAIQLIPSPGYYKNGKGEKSYIFNHNIYNIIYNIFIIYLQNIHNIYEINIL